MAHTLIPGHNFNELTDNAISSVLEDGLQSPSRNGKVQYLNNVVVELYNPMARHLALEGRKNNIYATLSELFWVMSGSDLIDPYLSFFLPRAKDYSDDNISWRGAYGPRLYMFNQLQNAINVFKLDGLETRRSVISIYDPSLDSGVESKDIPCNNLIHFYITEGKMNMNVVSRSSDLIWGLFGINIPEWTFLQEYVAQKVGVPLGSYTHFTTNLHIYDTTRSQADDVYETDQDVSSLECFPCVFPDGRVDEFFKGLVNIWIAMIEGRRTHLETKDDVLVWFVKHDVPMSDNTLFHYSELLTAYIANKLGIYNFNFPVDLERISDDLYRAVAHAGLEKLGIKGSYHGRTDVQGSL